MANGHNDDPPDERERADESAGTDHGGPLPPADDRHAAARESKDRTVLVDQSSQTNQHLESLVSLEQKVLSLLSDPNADGKAEKREARIFPAAKTRQEQTPALDEIKIFRPAKHDTSAPTGPPGDDGSIRESSEPAEPAEPAGLSAPLPSEETDLSGPEDGAPATGMAEERPVTLEEGEAPQPEAALEEAQSPETDDGGDDIAITAPAEAQEPDIGATTAEGGLPVDEAATDDIADRAEGHSTAREAAAENERLQDSWEPIDLGAILHASLEPASDDEDGKDSTPEAVGSAAPPEGAEAEAPLSPANDDGGAGEDGLAPEGPESHRADAQAVPADTEQAEESPRREQAAAVDPDLAPTADPDRRTARIRAELDTAQDNAEGASDAIGEAQPQTIAHPPAADGRPATGDGTAGSEVVRLRTRGLVARGVDAGADISAAPSQNAPPVLVADNAGLVADGIGKRFKQRQVLRGVGLTVQRGEVVGLLGPNGAGKTTCFYIITGLISPDYGTISLDDQNITELPMYRRARMGIGYLPQEPSIFRGLSVENNIRSVLESVEPDRQAREAMLDDLLAEFSITHLRRTPALALSGGERRRVEIARALASQPSFILLDEPLAGIDPIALGDIRDLVAHLKDRGIGVLITDHNVRETLEIVDRAYIIYNGEVLMSGKPSDIVAHDDVRRVYLGDGFSL